MDREQLNDLRKDHPHIGDRIIRPLKEKQVIELHTQIARLVGGDDFKDWRELEKSILDTREMADRFHVFARINAEDQGFSIKSLLKSFLTTPPDSVVLLWVRTDHRDEVDLDLLDTYLSYF